MMAPSSMLFDDRKRKMVENASISRKISTKDNLKLRWLERLAAAHLPSANFIFEITFPDVDSMRFVAIPRSIHYAEDSDEFMECYVVQNVMPFFSNVLYSGDILLRVNGQSLLRKSLNGEFIDPQKSSSCFENIATAAQSSLAATPPSGVTIRFMRSGSASLNFTPSPAELNLLQVDKHIAAKLLVSKVTSPVITGAGAGGGLKTATTGGEKQQQQWCIQLSYLDPQLPSSISQMMLGGCVTWDHTLLLSRNDATALAQCTQAGMLVSGTGSTGTNAGPGAFYAPNGAPAGLSDSWVAPASSLYASVQSSGGQQTYDTSSVTVAVAVAALMSPLGSAGAGVDNKASDAGAGQKGGQDSAGDAHRGGEQQQLLRASGRVYLLDATTLSSGITGTSGAVNIGGGASVGLGGGLMGAGLGLGGLNAAGMGVGGLHGSNSYGGSMSLAGALGGAGFGGNSANKLNKEAGRWVAVLEIAVQAQAGGAAVSIGDHSSYSSNSCDSVQVQQFNLGRFDREQDAKLALDQAIKEVGETKQFRPKHFLARLSVAYTAACQLQHKTLLLQQQQQGGGKAAGAGSGGFGGGSANSHNKFFNMQSAAARGGASGGGGGSSSSGNMAALLAQANCVGEASCGFDSVAKVVLPPSGVHTSYSNNNISALSMAHTHGLKK